VDAEYKKADEALDAHVQWLDTNSGCPVRSTRVVAAGVAERAERRNGPRRRAGQNRAVGEQRGTVGRGPAGSAVLKECLRTAMIAFTPEELISLATKEFAWRDKECFAPRARWDSEPIGSGAGGGEEQVCGAGPNDLFWSETSRTKPSISWRNTSWSLSRPW
jgi:hypothetical protein